MITDIELGEKSEPIDGPWRWYHCQYTLDGVTWLDGEIQSDGHDYAIETLVDDAGNKVE